MTIQKAINRAIAYVDSLKTYTKAAGVIDDLLKSVLEFSEITEKNISDLQMTLSEFEYHQKENERLKRILRLYGAEDSFRDDEIDFLERVKDSSQFYTDNSAREILYQYVIIDIFLKKFKPDHKTRPTNINQIQKGYDIIVNKYGSKN